MDYCLIRSGSNVVMAHLKWHSRADEVEVLAFLMSRHGMVASKVEVVEAVWGAGFEGDHNIVEVYVRHLRREASGRVRTHVHRDGSWVGLSTAHRWTSSMTDRSSVFRSLRI